MRKEQTFCFGALVEVVEVEVLGVEVRAGVGSWDTAGYCCALGGVGARSRITGGEAFAPCVFACVTGGEGRVGVGDGVGAGEGWAGLTVMVLVVGCLGVEGEAVLGG